MPLPNFIDLLELPDNYYEGQIAQTRYTNVESGQNADSAIIVFGRGVVKGASDGDLLLPVDANSLFMGIAVETQATEARRGINVDTNGRRGWAPRTLFPGRMAYLAAGVIGVLVDGDVVQGRQAFCRFTGGFGKGVFRGDDDTAKAIAVPNSRYIKSVSGATAANPRVVPLAINIP